MINRPVRLSIISAFCISLAAVSAHALEQVHCALHLHSVFSGEKEQSLSEVVQEARRRGIDVVIPADHDLMRWEYGLWPLRNLIRKTRSDTSVLAEGPWKYIDECALVSKETGVLVIPGVESSPFYYWTGSLLKKNLTLHDWHKHLLVIGLDQPDQYHALPLVSNPGAGRLRFFLLWPVLLLIAAPFFPRFTAALILAGMIGLFNNYPFRATPFDPYHGPQGEKPYQALIDYAAKNGALTFWAHPEAPNWEKPVKVGSVSAQTLPYAESMKKTTGYTGFSIFSEGYRAAGKPGGTWDESLLQYTRGDRSSPVWAAGELDYGNSPRKEIESIQNVLWVEGRSKDSVLRSLREGRYFALWRTREWGFSLPVFYVQSGTRQALCGQTIPFSGPVRIVMDVRATDSSDHPFTVEIIRNGSVCKVLEARTPTRLVFEDERPLPPGKNYYRVMLSSRYPHRIATNPVFVQNDVKL